MKKNQNLTVKKEEKKLMNPEYVKFCCFVEDHLKKHPGSVIAVDQWRGQGSTWWWSREEAVKRVYEFDGEEWQVIYCSRPDPKYYATKRPDCVFEGYRADVVERIIATQCTNAKESSEDKETDG